MNAILICLLVFLIIPLTYWLLLAIAAIRPTPKIELTKEFRSTSLRNRNSSAR